MSIVINGEEKVIRELTNDDFFNFCDLLDRVDFNVDSIQKLVSDSKGKSKGDIQMKVGIKVMFDIVKQLGRARKEANVFLGSLVGLTEEEFAKAKFKDTINLVQELAKQEGFGDFLQQASAFKQGN
jgi:acetolactate synthase small subunit